MSGERRAALVTGAASGIGAAIAARLQRDVRGNSDTVATAIERFGRLDAVIPNAGFQHVAPIDVFPEDRWDAVIALLLTSPFLLARHAWPQRGSGPGAALPSSAPRETMVR